MRLPSLKLPPSIRARLPKTLPVKLPGTRRQQSLAAVILALLLVGSLGLDFALSGGPAKPSLPGNGPHAPDVTWGQVVPVGGEGYEPGLAVDSTGALYYTAHKDQNDRASYPYLASWFLMSTDNGATWASPTQPFPFGAKWERYAGDEGDIAVDSRDNVYFVDTYLIDNHLHVWANQGQWQYSEHIQKTTGFDDRPWITAQGSGILHYLGNNGQQVNGGRYWYYRSTNGGRTFTAGDPVPGNGWGEIDAERMGSHVYIFDEADTTADQDMRIYVSSDSGATWDWSSPVVVGHRAGQSGGFPLVAAGDNGMVYVMWSDITGGEINGSHIFLGRSTDYGATWNVSDITPFMLYSFYQSFTLDSTGTLGVAFYGTRDVPVTNDSVWYVYGGMMRNSDIGNISINFTPASPDPVYVGSRLNALGDLFESVITPDGAYNIAFEWRDAAQAKRFLGFVRGTMPD
jgi:hypothetical protein